MGAKLTLCGLAFCGKRNDQLWMSCDTVIQTTPLKTKVSLYVSSFDRLWQNESLTFTIVKLKAILNCDLFCFLRSAAFIQVFFVANVGDYSYAPGKSCSIL